MDMIQVLQVIVALGLLNVWLVRPHKETGYRGGQAKNLKDEFAAYGLAPWTYFLVGSLKVLAAFALIAGLWFSPLAEIASVVVVFLMIGALVMHIKVKDPVKKSLPALAMLGMSLAVALTSSLV
jgi:uncharacterized membrane protein YphA (DoxX/SURF4 family)